MFNRLPLFLSIFLLCVLSFSARAEGSSTEDEVKKAASTFFRAINDSNIKMVLDAYHRDSAYLSKNHPAAHGIDEIKKAYQELFGRVRLNVDHVVQHVFVDTSIAIIESNARGTVTILETMKTAPVDVKQLFVFRKVENQWKIDRYMFNDNSEDR